MILFEINGKKYGICNTAADISIKRYIELMELDKAKLPDCLRKVQQLSLERNKLLKDNQEDHSARILELDKEIEAAGGEAMNEDNELEVINWNMNLAAALSDCPIELWRKIPYNEFLGLLSFAYAAIDEVHNYQPKFIKSIYWKEEEWFLPAEKVADVTLGRFVQVKEFEKQAKTLTAGYYKSILKMLPVLLLKKDEEYSYGLAAQRKGHFDDMLVTDALDVAFFLTSKVSASQLSTHIYSIAGALSKLKKKRKR